MTEDEVNKLRPGLYLIFWANIGGTSHAAVGIAADGRRWLAPTDWTPVPDSGFALEQLCAGWEAVREVQPLTGPDAMERLEDQERALVRHRLERITALAVGDEPRAKDKIAGVPDGADVQLSRMGDGLIAVRLTEESPGSARYAIDPGEG